MNTPSPAPQRRRRQPLPAEPQTPEQPLRRRAQRVQITEDLPKSSRKSDGISPVVTFFEQIPMPVRIVLITLCIAVFLTCAVAITRNYLAEQEERRRLEAEAAERAQHPLEYAGLIMENALLQDVDPALIAAVILCESSYNPEAESRLGARGLMQLMEDTAKWVASKFDEDGEGYSFDSLFVPDVNIRYGAWYLGYLTRRFDGDATKVVCAYHAGQGNVDAWLKNPAYSKDGVTLDVIPTSDTAAYAGRVLRARDVYRKYYFPAATPQPTAIPQ